VWERSAGPLLVSARISICLRPDNGVLSVIYEREKESLVVRHANVEHYYLQPVSKTFHGRDIFAPVASGSQKAGMTPSMGDEISDFKRSSIPPLWRRRSHKGHGLAYRCVRHLITNFRAEDLPESALTGAIKLQVELIGNAT